MFFKFVDRSSAIEKIPSHIPITINRISNKQQSLTKH